MMKKTKKENRKKENELVHPGKPMIPREIYKEFSPGTTLGKKLLEEKKQREARLEKNNQSGTKDPLGFFRHKLKEKELQIHIEEKNISALYGDINNRKNPPDRKLKQNEAYLCGSTSETHRWAVNLDEGDFFKQSIILKRYRKNAKAIIGVRRTNFFKLDKVYNYIKLIRNQKKLRLPEFRLIPFHDIRKRFYSHLSKLAKLSEKDNIEFLIEDKELDEILSVIEKKTSGGKYSTLDLLRSLGPIFKDVFIGPRYILFNASAKCNTDCIYCRAYSPLREKGLRQKELKEMNNELDFKKAEHVIETAKKIGTELILIVGEGEPTTYSNFGRLVDSIKKNRLKFNFSTNGMLLDKYIDRLVNGSCNAVTVSMSWASEDTFRKIRPGTNIRFMSRIKENVKKLSDAKKKAGTHAPHIFLLHAINKRNYNEIPKMAEMAKELGADSIWYQMTHLSDFMVKELKLNNKEMARTLELLEEAREICDKSGIKFNHFIDFELKHFDNKKGDWSKEGLLRQGCFVGWHFAYIDLRDLVSFCCGVRYIAKLDGKKSFRDIWFSDAYRRYRNDGLIMHKENPVDLFGKPLYGPFCDSCDNHDQNTMMINSLKEYDLLKFVER